MARPRQFGRKDAHLLASPEARRAASPAQIEIARSQLRAWVQPRLVGYAPAHSWARRPPASRYPRPSKAWSHYSGRGVAP